MLYHSQPQLDESATSEKPTYYVVSMTETAIKPPSFKRPDCETIVTPNIHRLTPKEAVRFKSMTLKEAYSVPKHTSAICVQSFDDSLNSAIHITYRISLRSSSLREPRYPLLRVLDRFDFAPNQQTHYSQEEVHSSHQCVLTQSCTNKRVWLLMRLLHHSCSLARKSKAHKKHRHFARVGMDSR